MRCDDRHLVAMIKLIPFLNSSEPTEYSSKSIKTYVSGIVRLGVALKRKGGMGSIKMGGPFFQDVIIRCSLPLGFDQRFGESAI